MIRIDANLLVIFINRYQLRHRILRRENNIVNNIIKSWMIPKTSLPVYET